MFTGLIQDIGRVKSVDKKGDWRIVIETAMDMARHDIGASIACSGCCLTVVEKTDNSFAVDVSAESLSKTIIDRWEVGSRVNLEPSLRLGDEMGGHIVSGHVDGLARLMDIKDEGDSKRLIIELPDVFAPYVAAKGSIALDGISLTVNEVNGARFGVNIIAHTWGATTLSDRAVGDALNFEIDMLARYVARMMDIKLEIKP